MRIPEACRLPLHSPEPSACESDACGTDWPQVPPHYGPWHPPQPLQLFPPRRAPRPEDVKQDPQWEDCHILGPLQAVTARYPFHPHAVMRVVESGVSVRHFDAWGEPQTVVVSPHLLKRVRSLGRSGASGKHLWPAYLEKAWAASHGSMNAVVQRNDPSSAFVWLLGCAAFYTPLSEAHTAEAASERISQLLAEGECIVMHHRDEHCLSVLGSKRLPDGGLEISLLDPRTRWPFKRHRVWRTDVQDDAFKGYAATLGARVGVLRAIRLDSDHSAVVDPERRSGPRSAGFK